MVCVQPLHSKYGSDDIDDRIDGADLVEVYLIDGHRMDVRLRARQSLEQLHRTILSFPGQRRPFDVTGNLFQAVMAGVDVWWRGVVGVDVTMVVPVAVRVLDVMSMVVGKGMRRSRLAADDACAASHS